MRSIDGAAIKESLALLGIENKKVPHQTVRDFD